MATEDEWGVRELVRYVSDGGMMTGDAGALEVLMKSLDGFFTTFEIESADADGAANFMSGNGKIIDI